MSRLHRIIIAALVSVFLSVPAWSQSPSDAIETAMKTFAAAFNAGDAQSVAALYTEDGAILPPDGKRVDGRAGIAAFWKGAIDGGVKNLSLKAVEIDSREDVSFEIGDFSLDAPGEGGAMTTVVGKYVVVWKKSEDGTWRLHRDIWNAGAAK